MLLETRNTIGYVSVGLLWILIFSGFMEMLLFPGWDNLVGVIVSIASFILYRAYVFKLGIIRKRPMSFVAFSLLILFMYLPLPVTLIDGNEMSHHLLNPITTYLLQFLYFVCCIIAFNLADRYRKSFRGFSKLLIRLGFYTTPSVAQLWILGGIGWFFKLILLSTQYSGDGFNQAGRGTLSAFSILICAPLLIYFYPLFFGKTIRKAQKIIVVLYMVGMMILLVSTNSRNQVVLPLITFLLLYLMSLFYKRNISISKSKLIVSLLIAFFVVGPLSDMAFAMLVARAQRQNTKFTSLLEKTFEVYNDKEKLYKLKSIAEKKIADSKTIQTSDWDEYYVSSVFLGRVCNYRVIDSSIYHAQRAGMPNGEMTDYFFSSLKIMFPQPIVDFLFGHIDKAKYAFSPQDKLLAVSRNNPVFKGYTVGGDVGLNLSMFGVLAFPLTIVVFFLEFVLSDLMSYRRYGKTYFSFIPLLSIYPTYFLKFQVSGGLLSHISYLLWGVPLTFIMIILICYFIKFVVPDSNK